MDATSLKHSLCTITHLESQTIKPFYKSQFPVGVPLSKEFRRGELDGLEPFPFSCGFLLLLWIVFQLTLYLLESTDLLLSIARNTAVLFPLPLDIPLAVAAPEAGFSSCFSREEKCFSRVFFPSVRPPDCLVWCSLAIHPFEGYLECAATALA